MTALVAGWIIALAGWEGVLCNPRIRKGLLSLVEFLEPGVLTAYEKRTNENKKE